MEGHVGEVCLWVASSIRTETITYSFIDFFDERVVQRVLVVDVSDANSLGNESFVILQRRHIGRLHEA